MEQTPTSISVVGGEFFDLLKPEEYNFPIDVIATALSNLCRYTGHVERFYSVAEHCILVSHIVPEKLALEGLLHDASEAFVGDVSSPLKRLLPNYREIEDRIQSALANAHGLAYPFPDDIHKADKRAYWSERKEIAPGNDKLWHQELRASPRITPVGLTPPEARKLFLDRYEEINAQKERDEVLRRKAAA